MKYNLPERVERDIIKIARKNGVKKVILFGSRARCTNSERSDIDLAVSGGNTLDFYYDIKEKTHTLLMFDIVELDRGISDELQTEINRDGVILYEEI
ncbi:MAG: nucleotidyltransferase domain-containing protein [Ruminococcus flavefaciens]|nr:nucleotidyltransferase domain-containing protein [Ruminococcus flavefaciens]MCM1230411.1 nucleotidyltransferase domain-containing protein [Ruminococcus flavefaciens]